MLQEIGLILILRRYKSYLPFAPPCSGEAMAQAAKANAARGQRAACYAKPAELPLKLVYIAYTKTDITKITNM